MNKIVNKKFFLFLVFSQVFPFFSQVGVIASPQDGALKKPGIRDLQLLLRVEPKNTNAWLHLGIELAKIDRLDKALVAFGRVLKLDPDNFHAYNNLGIVYKKLNKPENAIIYYTRAVALNANSYWTWYNLGLSYEDLSLWAEARYAFNQVLKIRSDYQPAIIHLKKVASFITLSQKKIYTIVLKKKAAEKRSRELQRRLPQKEIKPVVTDALIARMRAKGKPADREFASALQKLKDGNISDAVFTYLKAVDLDNKVLIQSDYGLLNQGISHFRSRQADASGLYAYSRLLHLSGDITQAYLLFQRLIQEHPKSPYALKVKDSSAFLNRLISGKGDIKIDENDLGMVAQKEGQEVGPANSQMTSGENLNYATEQFEKGEKLFKENQIESSIQYFKEAVRFNPNASRFRHSLGLAYTERFITGDKKSGNLALQQFKKELEIDGRGETAIEARMMIEEIKKRMPK
ncbi:tetratricopeptide repeat protein [Candidatus Riflebacteria bacterium]